MPSQVTKVQQKRIRPGDTGPRRVEGGESCPEGQDALLWDVPSPSGRGPG
jgi:hypothetical protein